jgi:tetratricopeptide (TPR) repeat protein
MAITRDEKWSANLADGIRAYESGDYKDAADTLEKGLQSVEQQSHNQVQVQADLLQALANVYREQDQFERADSLYERAVELRELAPGRADSALLSTLRDYALSLAMQGRFKDAYGVNMAALDFADRSTYLHGSEALKVVANLAAVCRADFDYPKAEIYYRRYLAHQESETGEEDLRVLPIVADLALICYRQQKFAEAQAFYECGLKIIQSKDPGSGEKAGILNGLGLALCAQGRNHEAQPLCDEAARVRRPEEGSIYEQANDINDLADVYCHKDCFDLARPLCEAAQAARDLQCMTGHARLSNLLSLYVDVMKRLNCRDKTGRIEQRIKRLET